eukprot:6210726-Pleurochrysis_carterae.AAC.3
MYDNGNVQYYRGRSRSIFVTFVSLLVNNCTHDWSIAYLANHERAEFVEALGTRRKPRCCDAGTWNMLERVPSGTLRYLPYRAG